MTIEQIQDLKVIDCKDILMYRLSNSEATQEELDAEFILYKQELLEKEQSRLDEIARVKDIKIRLDSLDNLRDTHYSLNPTISNMKIFVKDSIMNNKDKVEAETILSAFEAEDSRLQSLRAHDVAIENRKEKYPTIEELVVAIIEEDSVELQRLKDLRNAIKLEFPKP